MVCNVKQVLRVFWGFNPCEALANTGPEVH